MIFTGLTLDDILARVERRDSGCWEWQGCTSKGYGQIGRRIDGKHVKYTVHRAVFAFMRRPLEDNELLCHRCDNRCCCNPDHLFVGTQADNLRDMKAKGRHNNFRCQQRRAQTHCKRGHALSGDNLYLAPKTGFRGCRTCRRDASKETTP